MVDCKKLKKQECIDNNTDCLWKVGVGCRNKGSVVNSNNNMILNPATNRLVKASGKI